MENKFPKSMKIVRFIFSGGIGAATNLGILYLLTDIFHIWYLLSSTLSTAMSLVVSFVLQKWLTFKNFETDRLHHQVALYLLTALIGLVINGISMYILVDKTGLHYLLAQIISMIVVAIFSFFMYEKIVFKKPEAAIF